MQGNPAEAVDPALLTPAATVADQALARPVFTLNRRIKRVIRGAQRRAKRQAKRAAVRNGKRKTECEKAMDRIGARVLEAAAYG